MVTMDSLLKYVYFNHFCAISQEMMAVFEADQVPYPNKYNDFKSIPVSGTPLHEKEHRSVPLLESLFGIGKKISIYGPHVV